MKLIPRSFASLSCALLLFAGVAFGSAWRVQAMAAERLEQAKIVQDRTVPDAGASAPSPEQNRQILENLATARDVRTAIDTSLKAIGSSVLRLEDRLRESKIIAAATRRGMKRLAAALGSSAGPSSVTAAQLRASVEALRESGRLGAEILEELRKLDRKSGGPLP